LLKKETYIAATVALVFCAIGSIAEIAKLSSAIANLTTNMRNREAHLSSRIGLMIAPESGDMALDRPTETAVFTMTVDKADLCGGTGNVVLIAGVPRIVTAKHIVLGLSGSVFCDDKIYQMNLGRNDVVSADSSYLVAPDDDFPLTPVLNASLPKVTLSSSGIPVGSKLYAVFPRGQPAIGTGTCRLICSECEARKMDGRKIWWSRRNYGRGHIKKTDASGE
jgi:hypothetical protein